MADFEQAVAIEGLRRITVHLSHGDIGVRRIEGDAVLVQSDGELQCAREGDTLIIGFSPVHSFSRPPRAPRPPASPRPGLSGLGEFIDDVVTRSLDSVFTGAFGLGALSDGLTIGIPAALEQPVLEVHTAHGDIRLDGVHSTCAIRTESGDIVVHHAGGSLDATTGMGDVQINGFSGPIRASTGSGDIDLRACPDGGAIQTGSGDVEGRDLDGNWRLHSGSGDLDLRLAGESSLEISTGAGDVTVSGGMLRSLQLQTGSGDIEVRSILAGDRHRLTTGQGDVTVGIADPPGARLQIITRSGSVHSEYPLVIVGKQGPQSRDGGRFVGNIGDSAVDVEIRSGSGDVRIVRLASARSWQAPTAVVLEVPDPADAPPDLPVDAFMPPVPTMDPAVARTAPAQPAGATSAGDAHLSPDPRPAADPRLAILESLKRGEISVDEASTLLGSLEATRS
jgi:hypothetical protein